jgi:EAL and modified HD-GYP domain-containing signal transduction protein
VARQPILDRSHRLFGYELLFREPGDTHCADASERATAQVITSALLDLGLDVLTQGRRAFINLTRAMLLSDAPLLLPARGVVLELLEDIEADDEVMAAGRALRRAGYTLALDDFQLSDRTRDLLDVADFVKVDFAAEDANGNCRRIVERCRSGRPALVGEKIVRIAQFDEALGQGFRYFQGFYFGQPVTQGGGRIEGRGAAYFRILRALHDANLTILDLEDLVKHDAAICYRILRAANAASRAQRAPVTSIRQALLLLGLDTVRRWASLWILAGLGQRGTTELVVMSVVRARCCELVGRSVDPTGASGGFLLGMCSLLDVMLGCPMDVVLEHLHLSDDDRDALLGRDTPSRAVLDCVIAYERGAWNRCLALAEPLGVDRRRLAAAYRDAIAWAGDIREVADES